MRWGFQGGNWQAPRKAQNEARCHPLSTGNWKGDYMHSYIEGVCDLVQMTCSLQTPRLPATDPAYPLTCSNSCVGLYNVFLLS